MKCTVVKLLSRQVLGWVEVRSVGAAQSKLVEKFPQALATFI